MKKLFLLTCMVLTALVVMAQAKKVAILEVVDREDKLSYSQKLVLRSNMAKAVTNTVGYEAYDRSDVDMIMSEQDFQRTGLVSDAEIRKLGEMTGVSLILVTEGALANDGKLLVSVKVLNVETARVEMTDFAIMNNSPENILEGCNSLAAKLFSGEQKNSDTKISKNRSKLYYKGERLDRISYVELLQNCPKAYNYYKKGRAMSNAGWVFMALGPAMITGGSIMLVEGSYAKTAGIAESGVAILCLGCATTTIVSIPLLSVGYHRQNNAYKIYNNTCASSSATPITFNLTAGQNGLGVAMNF